jgi:hypothetical protein
MPISRQNHCCHLSITGVSQGGAAGIRLLTLQPAQHLRRQSAVCDEADHADANVQHTKCQLEGTAHHIRWHHQQLSTLTERNCQLLKAWLIP